MVFATVQKYFEPTYVVEVKGTSDTHQLRLSKTAQEINELFRAAYETAVTTGRTQHGHVGQFFDFELDGLKAEFRLTKQPTTLERVQATLAPAIRPVSLAVAGLAVAVIVHYALLGNQLTQPHYANAWEQGSNVVSRGTAWLNTNVLRA